MQRARGADFSSYQSIATVSHVVNRPDDYGVVDFALVKTTEGAHYINPLARQQITLLEQGARPVGLYHFLTHDVDGAKQWDHFEQTLRWARAPIVACDQETDRGVLVSDAIARAFIKRGRQRGFLVGRYGDARVMGHRLGEAWRWYARWAGTPPADDWDVWQFAAGERGGPDWNLFRGNAAQLHAWWKLRAHVYRPAPPRWWLHDELEKRALGPYLLPRLVPVLAAYVARHPRSHRFELVRK